MYNIPDSFFSCSSRATQRFSYHRRPAFARDVSTGARDVSRGQAKAAETGQARAAAAGPAPVAGGSTTRRRRWSS